MVKARAGRDRNADRKTWKARISTATATVKVEKFRGEWWCRRFS
jgi:hypothetical protein